MPTARWHVQDFDTSSAVSCQHVALAQRATVLLSCVDSCEHHTCQAQLIHQLRSARLAPQYHSPRSLCTHPSPAFVVCHCRPARQRCRPSAFLPRPSICDTLCLFGDKLIKLLDEVDKIDTKLAQLDWLSWCLIAPYLHLRRAYLLSVIRPLYRRHREYSELYDSLVKPAPPASAPSPPPPSSAASVSEATVQELLHHVARLEARMAAAPPTVSGSSDDSSGRSSDERLPRGGGVSEHRPATQRQLKLE